MTTSNPPAGSGEYKQVRKLVEPLAQCMTGILVEARQKAVAKHTDLRGRSLANILSTESNLQTSLAWENFQHPVNWVIDDQSHGWFWIHETHTGIKARLHASGPNGSLRKIGTTRTARKTYLQPLLFDDDIRTRADGYPDFSGITLVILVDWKAIGDGVFAWIVRPADAGTWKDGAHELYRIPLSPADGTHAPQPRPAQGIDPTAFDGLLGKTTSRKGKAKESARR